MVLLTVSLKKLHITTDNAKNIYKYNVYIFLNSNWTHFARLVLKVFLTLFILIYPYYCYWFLRTRNFKTLQLIRVPDLRRFNKFLLNNTHVPLTLTEMLFFPFDWHRVFICWHSIFLIAAAYKKRKSKKVAFKALVVLLVFHDRVDFFYSVGIAVRRLQSQKRSNNKFSGKQWTCRLNWGKLFTVFFIVEKRKVHENNQTMVEIRLFKCQLMVN